MSEKITAMIEEIKGLTVLELSELVHALEEEFGVSAAAMAAPAAGAAAPGNYLISAASAGAPSFSAIRRCRSRCRGEDRVRRHPRRFRRRCEDQGHQGRPRAHRSGSCRGQGLCRVRSQGRQGRHLQGRCRGPQEAARGSRREGRDQVISPNRLKKAAARRSCCFFSTGLRFG